MSDIAVAQDRSVVSQMVLLCPSGAQGLFVTAKTVETHLRHVHQKLDVARRTDLAEALDAA